jgi:hypothetical protein
MRHDTEALLEHVLNAVMQADTDALTLSIHLRNTVAEARLSALIRALLSAEAVIRETFNGSSTGRADAALARSLALTLAEAADDIEAARDPDTALRLRDLSF